MNDHEAVEVILAAEKGKCWSDNGPSNWKGVIVIGGTEFKALKVAAKEALAKIEKCQSIHDLRNINLSYTGGFDLHYWARFSCPTEARIAELREEADDLERRLQIK